MAGSRRDRTSRYVEQVRCNGYCVVEGVIGADDLDRVRDDAIRVTHKDKHYRPDLGGIAAAQDLINYVAGLRTVSGKPTVDRSDQGIALLGLHPRVNSATALVTYPGNEPGDWHTDWPYNPAAPDHMPTPYPDMTMHLSTLWMLTPFNSETGGTRVIPASHSWGNSPSPKGTKNTSPGCGSCRPVKREEALAQRSRQYEREHYQLHSRPQCVLRVAQQGSG